MTVPCSQIQETAVVTANIWTKELLFYNCLGKVDDYFILGGGVIEPYCAFIRGIEAMVGNFCCVEVVPTKICE